MSIKEKLKHLKENEHSLYVIHYSCENLNDNNENYSPRVTSIAVLHLQSHTMHSFSIHLIAEKRGISRDDIDKNYNDIEKQMLSDFYDFVRELDGAIWLHWNMSNINYGFEALAHRYEVLTKEKAPRIRDTNKVNLSSLILARYGKNSIDHPRMQTLKNLNDGNHRDMLNGEEEVVAFRDKEYVKLHKSTMSKVYWFQSMYFALKNNRVKVSNYNLSEKLNKLLDNTFFKILGLAAVVFTLVQGGMFFYEKATDESQIQVQTQRQEP
ncbi:hypothetical protein O1C66_003700 [Vibrio cholerae]|uniref:hypothetical protein n=1 Tax=Vibrio cholerae TaxID=666 RepID=UPI000E0B20D7|nr:hypothetical protein [Vibrio cholerae]EGQ8412022.1 hypothetical protein [Vibrio cholerae]EJK2108100.1 hypothetical protein [Vibrio cholerae]EKF9238179.1 hypothetical protein [Vibrio cholerae]EKF9663406.1 hypothetical protein [Vibrio cholerae]